MKPGTNQLKIQPKDVQLIKSNYYKLRLNPAYKQTEKNFSNFSLKYFNIIDPIYCENNLGRSINKSNSFRIKRVLRKAGEKALIFKNLKAQNPEKYRSEIKNLFSKCFEFAGVADKIQI